MVCILVSTITILGAMALLSNLVADNASAVVNKAPVYQQRLQRVYSDLADAQWLQLLPEPLVGQAADWFRNVNLGALIANVASSMAGLLGNGALVVMYLFFILLEYPLFRRKLQALVPQDRRRQRILHIIQEIDRDIRAYLGLKTVVSLLTAALSYGIMAWVGLDFAAFWALIIFILNFIPNLGSLVATLLPTVLALVQFDSLRPFAIVGIGVTAVQLGVANFVEPPLMGKTLNMSPLVVVVSLTFWGGLWGLVGMFLCVPITAVAMIILSHFPSTRWVSIALSQTGEFTSGPQPLTAAAAPPAPDPAGATTNAPER
jgi:predicted PurR-regulated permease PerM